MSDADTAVTTEPPAAASDAATESAPPPPADGGDTAAPPPFWGEGWRERLAGGNEDEMKQLRRYASPEGIWKKIRHLEKKLSSGDLKPVRPDTDDEAVLAEWRKQVGAPDTPEDYLKALPREIDIPESDAPAIERIFKTMHAQGLPTEQAKEVVSEYYRMQAEWKTQLVQQDYDYRIQSEENLRAEWGPEYRANINAIGLLFDRMGSKDLLQQMQAARLPDGRKLGDNPEAMKFLAAVARDVVSDGGVTITPQGGMNLQQSIAHEKAALEREMQATNPSDPSSYWKNPEKQARYLELLQAEERMQARGR